MRSMCSLALAILLFSTGCSNVSKPLTPQELYSKESLGVVRLHIKVKIDDEDATATCSGSIIDGRGYILTAGHCVVKDASFTVNFQNDPLTDLKADLVAVDHERDLALLKLENPPKNLVVIKVAEEDPSIGETVYIIGMPLGNSWYFTNGIVSGYTYVHLEKSGIMAEILQTNTNINRGNSGGPMMNDRGEIVGVVSFMQFDAVEFWAFPSGIGGTISDKMIRDFLTDAEGHIPPSPTAIACPSAS